MLIYLLRHGLTEYNAQKRYQGQRDIPLSPEGLAQQHTEHRQHAAHVGFIRRRGKSMGQAGVFCHGERCHRQPGERPLPHQC